MGKEAWEVGWARGGAGVVLWRSVRTVITKLESRDQ
jgi:hypothetical protein